MKPDAEPNELCGEPRSDGMPCQALARTCPHHGPIAPGNPGSGRPSTYDPKYCKLVEEIGAEGGSYTAMAVQIGITRKCLYEWRDRYEEFGNALERAREASMKHWEGELAKGVWGGKDFNDRALKYLMSNLFPDDWRESRDVNIRAAVATMDLSRLPNEYLKRIRDGEDPDMVLAEAAEVGLRAIEAGVLPGRQGGDGAGATTQGEIQEAEYEEVDDEPEAATSAEDDDLEL